MFWGLNLKPNRKYTQTTSKSFHISQAALDADSAQSGANQIYISCENQKFLICTLRKDVCEQVLLDLNFAEGDEICFQSLGTGNVSLSGYLIKDDPLDDLMNSEEEEESDIEMEEDLRNVLNKKPKAKKSENASKGKAKAGGDEEEEDDDDEDDSDFNGEAVLEGLNESDDDAEEADSDEDEEEEADSDEEDESEDEEVPQPKAKQPKLDKSQKQQNGLATKETAAAPEKKGKKDKKAKKENQQPQQQQQQQQKQQQKGERSLTGGVKVEDIRVGNGPEAKTGKRAQVYYEGRLKSNNKVFDSLKQGAGFKFGLGRGEVIKGWDVGVVGMKVGGKRRITCPPHMAYGARGSPPSIPPNSTLVFEVELKSVN